MPWYEALVSLEVIAKIYVEARTEEQAIKMINGMTIEDLEGNSELIELGKELANPVVLDIDEQQYIKV
jgi:hypothetical protein